MKKTLISVLLAVLLLSVFTFGAFAEGGSVYRDDELQISFTMPDGWSRFSDAETGATKYAFSKDASEKGTYFVYNVVDAYANLSAENQSKFSRSDLNNSVITVEQFKSSMEGELSEENGITNLVVEPATVDGKSFFKLNFNQAYDTMGTENVVVYCHIYNGYETFYRYETFESVLDEAEAEAIVSSVIFESEKGSNKTQTDAQKTVTTIGKGIGEKLLSRFIIGAAVVLIGGVFTGIRVKKGKKKGEKAVDVNQNAANYNYNAIPTANPIPTENPAQAANPIPTQVAPPETQSAPTDENSIQ